jgi:hypothetical protein
MNAIRFKHVARKGRLEYAYIFWKGNLLKRVYVEE